MSQSLEPAGSPLQPDPKPFTVVIEQTRLTKPGQFGTKACVRFAGSLRMSGLLKALPAEELKSLLFVLSFVTPNGNCLPSVQELSAAMALSEERVRVKMARLEAICWQGQPVLVSVTRETGLDAFTPAPHLLQVEQLAPLPEAPASRPEVSHRAEVIEHSRRSFARPREIVERQIAEQLGHAPEEAVDTAEGKVRRHLYALGVSQDEIEELLRDFPLRDIQLQLNWLPERKAKSPARFIVAAIRGGYEPPLTVRLAARRQAQAEGGTHA